MNPALQDALVTFGIALLSLLTGLAGLLLRRVGENTQLTRETKNAADGRLSDALSKLAAERNRVLGLQVVVRERDDRIAFIVARHPEVERTLTAYRDRRSSRVTKADELAVEQAALEPPEEPPEEPQYGI